MKERTPMANPERFEIEDKGDKQPIEFEVVLPPLPAAAEPTTSRPRGSRAAAVKRPPAKAPEPRVERFRAHGFMPAWNMLEVEGMGRVSKEESARRYLAFFGQAVVDEDWLRFCQMLQDRRNQIDTDDLGRIFETLYALYAGRPTPSA